MDNAKLKSRMSGKVQELQQPTENQNITAASAPETSLAPADSSYIALTSNALDLIRANLKHQSLTLDLFDVVKSPSGGSTVFEVPGLAGNEAAMELTGIVLDYTTPRAYWDTPDPVEGTPPVCMSPDSIISHDGQPCARCPYNDFGSKDGESNAKSLLKSSNEDGNEGKRENLSRNIKFAFTIFPKSAEFVEPAEKTLYHPAAWQNDKLV